MLPYLLRGGGSFLPPIYGIPTAKDLQKKADERIERFPEYTLRKEKDLQGL
jgi:hypothetical protein